ncbi:MAG: pentapeptide repeat-containing protein, partial [Polyangiaceae bacterium]
FLVEEAIFAYPITFENAHFDGSVTIRRSHFDDQLHLSRARITGNFAFQSNEAKDLFMYGAQVEGNARFDSCYFVGRALFSLDELTRREHLADVRPLHKIYKIYQGDDDAEEDLTKSSQYGVTHVNDLVSRFEGEVSFANTSFRQFVGFERVIFGTEQSPGYANFYNTQFGGEAHFERAIFHGVADFRTVGGTELSFNQTRFYSHWMLDDANVPGRLSVNETDLIGKEATVSFAGADIRSFGMEYRQILRQLEEEWKTDNHRMFYEQCTMAFKEGEDTQRYIDDPRLIDAKWNPEGTERLTDEAAIAKRARSMCINRTVDEYVRLKASFDRRSMSDEADWAYWYLKHHANHRRYVDAGFFGKVAALGEKLFFEKGFGWGVLLGNLAVTSLVVIVFFAMLTRLLCGDMEVIWDEQPCRY